MVEGASRLAYVREHIQTAAEHLNRSPRWRRAAAVVTSLSLAAGLISATHMDDSDHLNLTIAPLVLPATTTTTELAPAETTLPISTTTLPPEATTVPLETTTTTEMPAEPVPVAPRRVEPQQVKQGPLFDVSYPNCDDPIPDVQVGIIGLNGGQTFTANDCAEDEAQHFSNYDAYTNSNFVGEDVELANKENHDKLEAACSQESEPNFLRWCVAYHSGELAGAFNVQQIIDKKLKPGKIWIDVEYWSCPRGHTCTTLGWSDDPYANWLSIQGQIDGMVQAARDNHLPTPSFGIYAIWNGNQYKEITGHVVNDELVGWQNGLQIWAASGLEADQATQRCSEPSFTGGNIVYVQSSDPQTGLDIDFACPNPDST